MAETLSLLEFIQQLFTDEELRELFNRDRTRLSSSTACPT